jgi:gliding motility-associated-like protein
MKTRIFVIQSFILLLGILTVNAQKENNVWAFGDALGIDFNSSPSKLIPTKIFAIEGCASVCSEKGELLFYTNGLSVWDSTHTIMPNGSGLLGASSYSATQGVVISPVLGFPKKYFIFTLEDFNGVKSGYLRYSVVDMSLNGGKGDIMPGIKNNLLDTGMSEKMILAPACNGLWLITHDIDSPIFYSYKIDNPIAVGRPVISTNPGIIHSGNYYVGEMKLSPSQKNIALANWISPVYGHKNISKIELFDFDRNTGIVSSPKVIDSSNYAYSVEFSPDNNKLYVCLFDSFIHQYDLSLLPSLGMVHASKFRLLGDEFSSLRLGPDDKIYVNRHNYYGQISRINDPNLLGPSCNIEIDVPLLANSCTKTYKIFGNKTIRPIPGSDTLITSLKDTTICYGDNYTYSGDNQYSDFLWHDGKKEIKRTFDLAGLYHVSYNKGCTRYIDSIMISTKEKKFFESLIDTTFCFRESFLASPNKSAISHLWDDSSKSPSYSFNKSGKKWVISTMGNCVFNIDTFKVKMTNFNIDIKDTFLCQGDTIKLNAGMDTSAKYLWQDFSTNSSFLVYKPGDYWVNVVLNECSKKEDITIFKKTFEVNFSSDTTICQGSSVLLEVREKNASIKWQDGSTNASYLANKKGTYSATITKDNCVSQSNVFVNEVICEDCIRIPNIFTPNGDNLNDRFRILTACLIDQFSIMIYNRFGEQVFYTENYNQAWDGTFNGQLLNAGVYYYLLKVQFRKPNAQPEIYKGDITMVR